MSPVFTAWLFTWLRTSVFFGMVADHVFFPRLNRTEIKRPIVIVGNPRTGTTFLQRWMSKNGLGKGMPLYGMLYPSLTLRKVLKPFLPILEKVSPARHHSTAAHHTSLTSVETDDVSVLFRYFDGFFLYGFILAWDDEERRDLVDPRHRDTSSRDFDWLEKIWRRNLIAEDADRVIAKLFSIGPRMPQFLARFPDANVLYTVRDPVDVIPSGMSLVTGVLDKRFGFWTQPEAIRNRYLERLYGAFVMLLQRFHEDWTNGNIPHDRVFIVRYDEMMMNFDGMMTDLLEFIDHPADDALKAEITAVAAKQRAYKSKHKYDLAKYGLDAERIRRDCAFVYETFWPNGFRTPEGAATDDLSAPSGRPVSEKHVETA